MIPGQNTDKENIDGIYKLLSELGIKEVHFLPYHRLGESKYEKLGRNYNLKGLKTESDGFFIRLLKEFIDKYSNIKTQIGG